ncbi:MAG: purine-nucleoside phosphorylase [Christensenellales bacterium]|jgi:purine-nucleoside phosphorylase
MDIQSRIEGAVKHIKSVCDFEPEIGLVLGSGLGDYAETLENPVIINYADIPGFPTSSVAGHKSRFVLGERFGKKIIAMQGRFHFYEGYSQQELTIPVRTMHKLGVKKLLITNAAGGVNTAWSAGALMAISDHINYSGSNPLIGANLDEFGPRFPDMSDIYNTELREKLVQEAKKAGIQVEQGVYMMFTGPSYETPAEIRMARVLGADAVGMSTVPEAIAANHCGMKVLGISCITNMAAGVLKAALHHAEVMETANRVKSQFTEVLNIAIQKVF